MHFDGLTHIPRGGGGLISRIKYLLAKNLIERVTSGEALPWDFTVCQEAPSSC